MSTRIIRLITSPFSILDPAGRLAVFAGSEAADGPLLAVAQDPVFVVRRERVVAGAAVDHVSLPDAPTVEVPADDVVVAVAPVEVVLALAADDPVVAPESTHEVMAAVGLDGVGPRSAFQGVGAVSTLNQRREGRPSRERYHQCCHHEHSQQSLHLLSPFGPAHAGNTRSLLSLTRRYKCFPPGNDLPTREYHALRCGPVSRK